MPKVVPPSLHLPQRIGSHPRHSCEEWGIPTTNENRGPRTKEREGPRTRKDQGPRTDKDRGPRTKRTKRTNKDQGPRTEDRGPKTKDQQQGPRTKDQGSKKDREGPRTEDQENRGPRKTKEHAPRTSKGQGSRTKANKDQAGPRRAGSRTKMTKYQGGPRRTKDQDDSMLEQFGYAAEASLAEPKEVTGFHSQCPAFALHVPGASIFAPFRLLVFVCHVMLLSRSLYVPRRCHCSTVTVPLSMSLPFVSRSQCLSGLSLSFLTRGVSEGPFWPPPSLPL